MRPRRGAPPEEWDAWIDSIPQTDETGLVEARRAMAKQPVYDALSIEEDRSPILKYMGVYMGDPAVPMWPVIQEAD